MRTCSSFAPFPFAATYSGNPGESSASIQVGTSFKDSSSVQHGARSLLCCGARESSLAQKAGSKPVPAERELANRPLRRESLKVGLFFLERQAFIRFLWFSSQQRRWYRKYKTRPLFVGKISQNQQDWICRPQGLTDELDGAISRNHLLCRCHPLRCWQNSSPNTKRRNSLKSGE